MFTVKDKTRSDFIVSLFLVAIILTAYWQLPSHEFLSFDDNEYIIKNPHVHEGINWENIVWTFSKTDFGYWHPLTWMSHMLAFQLFGMNPSMHHLMNLFLHISSTLLLFFILKRMTGALWQSAFVAVVFALHPLNVESVAWISERKNVLSTFFWMLTILTYVCYTEQPNFIRYLLSIFVFVLGLMSKPMLVTLPFVLLLLDYWPLNRFTLFQPNDNEHGFRQSIYSGSRLTLDLRLVLEKIPFLFLSAVCIYLSNLSIQHPGVAISTASVPLKLRIANALVSYVGYIKKMVWPHNLAVYYPYPKIVPLWEVFVAVLFLTCVTFLAFRSITARPYFAIGWLWYIGTLVPGIGLVQAGLWPAMADRFTYVPLIGLFICMTWGGAEIIGRLPYKKAAFIAIPAIIIPILLAMTELQLRHWQNGVTLFTHELSVIPDNGLAHYELGNAFEQQGDLYNAIFHYSKALKINPNYAEAHNNLGYILAQQKHYKEAIGHYKEALRIKPGYSEACNNLGTAFLFQGNEKEAVYQYYKALKINPNYAGAYYNLGKVFENHANIEKAILFYKNALELNPEMTQALYNLSWILATHADGKYRNGKEAFKTAGKLCKVTQYQQPLALDALAAAYAETGKFSEAVTTEQKAIRLALPDGPEGFISGLNKRLELYRRERPYRQPVPGKKEG